MFDTNSLKDCDYGMKINITRQEIWLTISGKEVSSSTLVTNTPVLSRAEAVPPVETIVNLKNVNRRPGKLVSGQTICKNRYMYKL